MARRMADLGIIAVDKDRDTIGLNQVEQVRPVPDQAIRQALLPGEASDQLLMDRALLKRILISLRMCASFELKRIDLGEDLASDADFAGEVVRFVMMTGN